MKRRINQNVKAVFAMLCLIYCLYICAHELLEVKNEMQEIRNEVSSCVMNQIN